MRYDAQVERMEVPFIWAHRRDYLLPQMTRRHLWYVYSPTTPLSIHAPRPRTPLYLPRPLAHFFLSTPRTPSCRYILAMDEKWDRQYDMKRRLTEQVATAQTAHPHSPPPSHPLPPPLLHHRCTTVAPSPGQLRAVYDAADSAGSADDPYEAEQRGIAMQVPSFSGPI